MHKLHFICAVMNTQRYTHSLSQKIAFIMEDPAHHDFHPVPSFSASAGSGCAFNAGEAKTSSVEVVEEGVASPTFMHFVSLQSQACRCNLYDSNPVRRAVCASVYSAAKQQRFSVAADFMLHIITLQKSRSCSSSAHYLASHCGSSIETCLRLALMRFLIHNKDQLYTWFFLRIFHNKSLLACRQ